jgi:hypothetical protein
VHAVRRHDDPLGKLLRLHLVRQHQRLLLTVHSAPFGLGRACHLDRLTCDRVEVVLLVAVLRVARMGVLGVVDRIIADEVDAGVRRGDTDIAQSRR